MEEKAIFYRCEVCGNIVELIKIGGGTLVCCGQPMTKLVPNTTDASLEKHVPVANLKDGAIHVAVGSIPHPMAPEHFIEWIAISNGKTMQRISLSPADKPEALFCFMDNAEVYAYCNLHGLWKAGVK